MKRLVALLASISLVLAFVVPVESATPKVTIWPNANFDTVYEPQALNTDEPLTYAKSANVSDFTNVKFDNYDDGNNVHCPRNKVLTGSATISWNDCISSLKLYYAPCTLGVRFYNNAAYNTGDGYVTYWGGGTSGIKSYSSLGLNDDDYSSMKWVTRTSCPLTEEP